MIDAASNPLGQDWNDPKNLDDLHPSEIVLPVGKKVRVRITARDVLHNFYLPQFRVKMDAIPGIPTYFVFTPTKTTEEYREELSKYAEYNKAKDPNDPESKMIWEEFNYELACAELCGASHFSMRRLVKIVSQEEYDAWLSQQKSYYLENVRNKPGDPLIGQVLDVEVRQRREDFNTAVESALADTAAKEKIIALNYVQFETGSNKLTADSRYEISNLADILKKYPAMRIEIGGHTDNTGDAAANLQLSRERADVVFQELVRGGVDASRLTAVGYGSSKPLDTNDTDAARQKNRRTEFKILAQ
jgi:cytochrome c oxidase subunit 2